MLTILKHTYELTHEENDLLREKIIKLEESNEYKICEDYYNPVNDRHILSFKQMEETKIYCDVFVKWNDQKEEKPYARQLTFEEMIKCVKSLMTLKKQHFINKELFSRYPEYVRVE